MRDRHNRPLLQRKTGDRPLFHGYLDPIATNNMQQLVTNLTTLQRERNIRSSQPDERRDYDNEFGYPKTPWSAQDYHDLIVSEPMADVVNSIFPLEMWQSTPTVFEDEDSNNATEFEDAWDELAKSLEPDEPENHHAEERGSMLWSFLQSADILSGEGRYGLILIGTDDGPDLSTPVRPRKGRKLLYLRAFPEYLAKVTQFEQDQASPRYGRPTQYLLQFADVRNSEQEISEPNITQSVHWSRVVPLKDTWHTPSSSPNFAIPRIRPVRNPLLDIRKVRGGSAEGYYQACVNLLHFGTHPSLGADVDVNREELQDMYEQVYNGLQRALFTSGIDVKNLAPNVPDPAAFILAQAHVIAMKIRIPIRKLIGNETGERATEDDRKQWQGTLASREQMYGTPKIIVPFTNRLINLGILPTPAKGFKVSWPDPTPSDLEKAQTLYQRTQAYALYTTSGMEATIPPIDYMTKFDSMEEEEAQGILDSAEDAQEEMAAEAQAIADEHGLVPEVDGFKEPTPDPIEVAKATAQAKASVKR